MIKNLNQRFFLMEGGGTVDRDRGRGTGQGKGWAWESEQ